MSERIKVIYIASLGHSGSTLVDMLLSSHSQIFSVGEVVNLSSLAHMTRTDRTIHKLGNECTCGAETIWQCPFWLRVEAILKERWDLSLRDLELKPSNIESFARDNRVLFEAVGEASGTRYIVDSSKDPYRLQALIDADVVDIIPIHLFRDPRGMINSRIRKGKGLFRAIAHFNQRTWRIRRAVAQLDGTVLRYERLVKNPTGEIRRIMDHLGLAFEPDQMNWAGRERHNIGGNRMRRTTDSTIREDLKWKRELRPMQRLAINTLTLPARLMTPATHAAPQAGAPG